jgi:hypothetical protein
VLLGKDNQPQVTLALKTLLGPDYMYDSTVTLVLASKDKTCTDASHVQPVYRAVYRAFTQCYFVEDDDEVVFYKDKNGRQGRQLARDSVLNITKT